MDFFWGWDNQYNLKLTLSNQGVGPAVITKVEHVYNGKVYNQWDTVLDAAGLKVESISLWITNEGNKQIMARTDDQDQTFSIEKPSSVFR